MTILAAIGGQNRGIAWADSMVFAGGSPVGHEPKLLINPLIGAIAVGCGRADLLRDAELRFIRARCVEELRGCVSAALRKATLRLGHALDRDRDDVLTALAVLSRSKRYGRYTVTTWQSSKLFVPEEAGAFVAPDVPGAAEATDRHSIVACAAEQMCWLRQDLPAAAGWLTVAEIDRDGVRVWRPFDVDTGLPA